MAAKKGGKRPGAGRPRGAETKKKVKLQQAVTARIEKEINRNQSPLEFMLAVMRDDTEDKGVRLEAAKAAAPFVHARLAAVTVKDETPQQQAPAMSDMDLARKLAFLLHGLRTRLEAKQATTITAKAVEEEQ